MRYCVICETSVNRKWFDREQDAIEHAKELIRSERDGDNGYQGKKPKTMMIVAATKYVRLASPPIEVVDVVD